MALYIADYLRKTTHLGALESGGYLHLIMDYWQNDGLPDDDKKLARIARMTDREWKSARPTIQAFFHDGWKHERIDQEISEAVRIGGSASEKAREAANKRWSKHNADKHEAMPEACSEHAGSNAPECTLHTSLEERKKDGAAAPLELVHPPTPEADYFRRFTEVLGANSRGLAAMLLKFRGGNVALARSDLERASTKFDPKEYIGAIIRGRGSAPEDLRARGEAW
jgi:uncharacterized protein YdaU (DUF1376 family)